MNNRPSAKVLHHRVYGEGRPVVFLHGFLESITMWKCIELPAHRSSILIDLPGHGNSNDHFFEGISIDVMADAVLQVLDKLNVGTFDIVGHSLGGYVALVMKEKEVRCEKITLMNSNFWGDSAHKKKERLRVAKIARSNAKLFIYESLPNLFFNPERFDSEVKACIQEALKIRPEIIADISLAMGSRKDYSHKIAQWAEYLCIIQGAHDPTVDASEMRSKLRQDITYFELNETGHMAHIEESEKVSAYLSSI